MHQDAGDQQARAGDEKGGTCSLVKPLATVIIPACATELEARLAKRDAPIGCSPVVLSGIVLSICPSKSAEKHPGVRQEREGWQAEGG